MTETSAKLVHQNVLKRLKDDKMGNKFIQDASQISFDFNGDRCNMKMVTTFNDNSGKKWDVELIVQTRAAAE